MPDPVAVAGAPAPSGIPSGTTGRQMPDSSRVSVVVVNRNGGGHLARCLGCLAGQEVRPARILVVDNGSTDDSLASARQVVAEDGRLGARVTFHEAGCNLGFAAANNLAVGMCDSEFVALLNPDAFPEPGWLAALLTAAEGHPEAAAFGSRQMLEGRPGVLDGVGDVYHVSGLSWRDGHGCRIGPGDLLDREIFSACAAAALYRRAAFLEASGFDEDFFCYFEDVDLGFRLRLLGYRARNVSSAVVAHVGGAAAGKESADFAVYYGHRNLVWCLFKNMPAALLPPALLAHFGQSIVVGIALVLRGRARGFVKAKWHAVEGLPKCWRKRKAVQAQRRIPATAIWKMLRVSPLRRRS